MSAAPEEFAARLARLRGAMRAADVELLLVDHAECIAWLAGYTTSENMYRAALVPLNGDPWIVLRDLDAAACRHKTWIGDVIGFPDAVEPQAVVAETIRAHGFAAARIGADFQSYGFTAHTRDRLAALLPQASFHDLPRICDRIRVVKSAAETATLGRAAAIADIAMARMAERIGVGTKPRSAAAIAAATFLEHGADSGDTGPILRAAGNHEFLHGAVEDIGLADGDVLHVELIPKVDYYCARLMRPILVGQAPRGLLEAAETLIALQDRQIAAMRPGVEAAAVDAILRDGVLAAGLRPSYDNITGYVLGIYARTPRSSDFSYVFRPTSDWRLESGMVFHMYTSAQGLGFSETVVVTDEGGRRLTRSPREVFRARG